MKVKLCCVVILGAVIFGICYGVPLKTSEEEEAKKFTEDASTKLSVFYDKLVKGAIGLESEDIIDALVNALEMLVITTEVLGDVVGNASVYAKTKYKDDELNYALNKLKKGEGLFSILAAMTDLDADNDIEGYKNDKIKLSYFPDIQKIFATSNDPEEMKYYWNAWREKNDKWAKSNLLDFVDSTKDNGKVTDTSPYEFWMKDFNMTQMDAVMEQIGPFYRQLHAFLRYQLNKKYGNDVVDTKGLIPDHLFQQLLAQAWTSGSVIDENFPHKDLPPYDEILAKNNYDTLKVFKTADKFYESMGLEAVPESFWGTKLKMKKNEDEGDCKAVILKGKSEVFMQYCHKKDFRTFLQAHGYMAEIHFALEKSHLPAYYTDSYNLDYAVGEAVILSASTPKHLTEIGITTDFKFTDEVLLNRLMRLSIHTMLNIPVYYVHTKVMADLFAGKVEMTELNKHYWELMDKYVGVGPPGDRESNTFDFPLKFYLEFNENKPARKFFSEVLSYQFYMKLCSICGQYPKGPLQNCDFYGSKDAGDVLKKMIKLGSSKPIHEVLAVMLPNDPKLNGESLLEYYSPASSWISSTNQQKHINIGWTHSDKKIGSVKLPEGKEKGKEK